MSGPQLLDSLTELPRTVIEVGLLTGHWMGLVRNAPAGEPHPVMVLPGFMGGDDSTCEIGGGAIGGDGGDDNREEPSICLQYAVKSVAKSCIDA